MLLKTFNTMPMGIAKIALGIVIFIIVAGPVIVLVLDLVRQKYALHDYDEYSYRMTMRLETIKMVVQMVDIVCIFGVAIYSLL